MAYHTACVARGNQGAMLMADLPFMSYATPEQAMESAARLMQAGAQIVKLEGGGWLCESVHKLSERGVPVCPHLGLTPQAVNALGGYRVQGRERHSALKMLEDAKALEDAGASLVLHDMLGITPGRRPRFVKNFMADADSIEQAVRRYGDQVRAGTFPGPEHGFE
jgi:3-methyl-2-oxobutanoate hydroxymethyltransferase